LHYQYLIKGIAAKNYITSSLATILEAAGMTLQWSGKLKLSKNPEFTSCNNKVYEDLNSF